MLLLACASAPLGLDSGATGTTGPEQLPGDSAATADSAADSGPDPDTGSSSTTAWETLLADRDAHLAALGEVVLACVVREDTPYPAFHGCYDWHSAVHGHWALYRLATELEDEAWAEAADLQILAGAEGELELLDAGIPAEMPYGYAWFLALARRVPPSGTSSTPTPPWSPPTSKPGSAG